MIIKNIDGKVIFEGNNLSNVDLRYADLSGANLSGVDLSRSILLNANLTKSNLTGAFLSATVLLGANLCNADLSDAFLPYAYLQDANLRNANLTNADLSAANLSYADLSGAILIRSNLLGANLLSSLLSGANLSGANLEGVKGLVKKMGVEAGNYYWKRFDEGLKNNDYKFKVGLNKLKDGEKFNSDPRALCAYPGFHFGSRSWCKINYPMRPLEALIKIPENAEINEPYATNGQASANMIEIIKIYDTRTGEDVTEKYQ